MATTKRAFVFATFILSCAAGALLVTALATKMWVVSSLTPDRSAPAQFPGSLNYGLFTGTYEKQLLANLKYVHEIVLTCLMAENACAWSCQATASEREGEMISLVATGKGSSSCPGKQAPVSASQSPLLPLETSTDEPAQSAVPDRQFVNAGLWVSTILFLALALLVTAAATALGVLNAASNPSRSWMALDGLYFWNGAAAALDLIVLILWGSQFAATLTDNVALSDVIQGQYSSAGNASLGYSYWLVFVAMLVSASNIGVLAARDYLLSREPAVPAFNPDITAKDGTIFLY